MPRRVLNGSEVPRIYGDPGRVRRSAVNRQVDRRRTNFRPTVSELDPCAESAINSNFCGPEIGVIKGIVWRVLHRPIFLVLRAKPGRLEPLSEPINYAMISGCIKSIEGHCAQTLKAISGATDLALNALALLRQRLYLRQSLSRQSFRNMHAPYAARRARGTDKYVAHPSSRLCKPPRSFRDERPSRTDDLYEH